MATNEVRYREAERRLWDSVGVTPTEQRLHLARTDVTVRVQEVGEGPAVVFVHGGSICGASWAPLIGRLDGFRCVVLDRPGCGLSDPLVTGFDDVDRLAAFADALAVDVLDALGLETAPVVGTSFGGYMVLRAAAAHPERISRVLEYGWPLGAPIARTPILMRLTSIRTLGRLFTNVPVNERAVRAMLRQMGLGQALDAGRLSQEGLDWMLALLRHTDTMRNELEAGPRFIHPLRGVNDSVLLPEELLASIEAPTFFLWGEEDPFGGADVARRFVAHLPHAELELMPGAGHAVWMDDPDHAAATARRFLGG